MVGLDAYAALATFVIAALKQTLHMSLHVSTGFLPSKKIKPSPVAGIANPQRHAHAVTKRSIIMKHNQNCHPLLSGQQIALNRKHLGRDARSESIHLPRVLLHLPRVEQRLQSARLLGQLEQSLPFIFREERLLRGSARSVLSLALLLPSRNLSLLTRKGSLVVLIVVDLCVVVLNALKEQVARLLQEGVDGKIERVVVREERWLGDVGVLLQGS